MSSRISAHLVSSAAPARVLVSGPLITRARTFPSTRARATALFTPSSSQAAVSSSTSVTPSAPSSKAFAATSDDMRHSSWIHFLTLSCCLCGRRTMASGAGWRRSSPRWPRPLRRDAQRIVCLSEAAEKMYRVRKSGARHRARPVETGGAYVRRLLRHGATGRES